MTKWSTHGTASNAQARLAEDGLLVKTAYARTRIPEIHRRPAPGAGGAAPEDGTGRPRRHAGARARDQGGGGAGAGGEAGRQPTTVAGCVLICPPGQSLPGQTPSPQPSNNSALFTLYMYIGGPESFLLGIKLSIISPASIIDWYTPTSKR